MPMAAVTNDLENQRQARRIMELESQVCGCQLASLYDISFWLDPFEIEGCE